MKKKNNVNETNLKRLIKIKNDTVFKQVFQSVISFISKCLFINKIQDAKHHATTRYMVSNSKTFLTKNKSY